MSYPYGPPQPGYPPPPYQPPYQGYPVVPPPPSRSSIPRVIGIIAIVFSVLGVLMNVGMYAAYSEAMRSARHFGLSGEVGALDTWVTISFVLGFLIFVLHLAGGITATLYKRVAPLLISIYAVVALLAVTGDLVVALAFSPDDSRLLREAAQSRLGFAVLALPWPIVALVLMNLRGAKQACGVEVGPRPGE